MGVILSWNLLQLWSQRGVWAQHFSHMRSMFYLDVDVGIWMRWRTASHSLLISLFNQAKKQTTSKRTRLRLSRCAAECGYNNVNAQIHDGELNHQSHHFSLQKLILETHSEQIDSNEPWLFMLSGSGSLAGRMTNAAWVTLRKSRHPWIMDLFFFFLPI